MRRERVTLDDGTTGWKKTSTVVHPSGQREITVDWPDGTQEKKIEELRLVIVGTGPSGIGCANLLLELGVRLENLVMVDHRGVLYDGREGETNLFIADWVEP